MKTIKMRIVLIMLLGAIMVPVLQSCNKYEEGPSLSLMSRTARLANQWKVENYKINGSDYTSLMGDYEETYSKNGAYTYTWSILNGSGTWKFQNNDMEIKLEGNDDRSSRTLYILKLEKKSFWYYYIKDGDRHEMHMIWK